MLFIYTVFTILVGMGIGIYAMRYFYPYNNISSEIAGEQNEIIQDVNVSTLNQETLCVDTKYIIEEYDVDRDSVVETTWRLPDKYIGMNREQFLEAMKLYESFPPLSERERGFLGLQVLSFSRQEVAVRKEYQFIQPSPGFYIAVYNNKIRVYLDDKKTIYIDTEINLDQIPKELQKEIINMMYVESEEELYDFLETYSS